MQDEQYVKRSGVDVKSLPANFPTQLHSPTFWEAFGRAVATFSFLEDTLGKAIFSFTATREYPEEDVEAAFQKWLPTLRQALSDPLGGLIGSYGNAVRENPKATISHLDELLEDLRKAATVRNVLCHGSWCRQPDHHGRSVPFFVSNRNETYKTPIGVGFLVDARRDATALVCAVMNTVTDMGWQFPGTNGPGTPILQSRRAKG